MQPALSAKLLLKLAALASILLASGAVHADAPQAIVRPYSEVENELDKANELLAEAGTYTCQRDGAAEAYAQIDRDFEGTKSAAVQALGRQLELQIWVNSCRSAGDGHKFRTLLASVQRHHVKAQRLIDTYSLKPKGDNPSQEDALSVTAGQSGIPKPSSFVLFATSPIGSNFYYDPDSAVHSDDGKTGKVDVLIVHTDNVPRLFQSQPSSSTGYFIFDCTARTYEFERLRDFNTDGEELPNTNIPIQIPLPTQYVSMETEQVYQVACLPH